MSHRWRGLGVCLVLVLAGLLASGTATAATSHVRTIDAGNAHPQVPFGPFDAYPIKMFDIDGDGDKEIIAHNDNQWLYIFDSRNGALLAEIKTPYPSGWGARPLNGPEVVVLVDGGRPHLIVANSAAIITSYRYDGRDSDDFFFTKMWERRLDGCGVGSPGMDGKPVLADLDGDGKIEILGLPEEQGGYALRADGSLMWRNCAVAGGNAAPVVNDLDGSGTKQVVWVSDSGELRVTDARNGATQWVFFAKSHANLRSASIPVSAAIGQIDGHGPLDIVFGARDSHDTTNYDNNHAALFAVNGHGGLIWVRQHPQANPLTYTVPVIHDVDNNGVNDIIWGDWNTVGHKGGIPPEDSWQTTGPANFYRYDAGGTLRWRVEMGTFWSNKDVPLADVDGDGVQEVLVNGPSGGSDGIWYLNSRTGAKEAFVSTSPWKVSRAPIVSDLWGSGTMQLVVSVRSSNDERGGLMIFNTHAGYNSAWPYPPDAGTHSSDRGSNPPPPPPPDGDFDASFRTPGGNEWWVEAYVDANQALAGVDARVDGGSWVALEKKSWGSWAKSMRAPDGSTVEFRARSTSGATDVSGGYRWPSGEPTDASPPPPPPPDGDFDASFKTSGGNEWWVEVSVTANEPLAGVDARVNGQAWNALSKTSWGTWSKSMKAPDGSIVEFRARSTSGASEVSGGYRWPSGEPAGSTPPPSSGDFTASFQTPGGNEWWVEVYVDANEDLSGVDARVNGQAWNALTKSSWGSWTKSMKAPEGSIVEFRATSTDGDTVMSGKYRWTSGAPA